MPENTTRSRYDRAKTLFISDLDGTLLNGVMIYDPATKKYLKIERMERGDVLAIIDAARAHATDLLLYRISEADFNVTRYFATDGNERLTSIFMDDVVDRRRGVDENVYGQSGIAVTDDISYFTFADTHERLQPIYELVTQLSGVAVVLSKDDYTDDGWFLECFSATASKANATRWIRENYGFEYVVAFGDNANDIEFVAQADEGYAPENAIPETKAVAKAIVASNADSGVAQWLEGNVLTSAY